MNANQKSKHCPVCGGGAAVAREGNLEVCAGCKLLPETEQYGLIQKRFEEAMTRTKALCSEAYQRGDQETVWTAKAALKELERSRARMRKPGEAR